MYSYLCPDCECENIHLTFRKLGERLDEPCDYCNHPFVVRAICRMNVALSMPEHFNYSTGQYVSNSRNFSDQLKSKSDEMSARLGMDVKYGEVDVADQKALGVTTEGIETKLQKESNPLTRQLTEKAFS